MKVIHEYTGEIIDYAFSQKVVIGEQDGHMLFGYVSLGETEDIVCFNQEKDFINKLKYTKGFGRFPYSFARHYEAIESFDIFKGEQIEDNSSKRCKRSLLLVERA